MQQGISDEQLLHWFTYHAPKSEGDVQAHERIRQAGYEFAREVLANTPSSADQTVAIRKVREAVMTANAAIACGGK